MGAGGFHGRVRDGIGCGLPAKATRSSNIPLWGSRPFWDWAQVLVFWVCKAERMRRCWMGHLVRVTPGGVWMTAAHGVVIEPIGRLGPVS